MKRLMNSEGGKRQRSTWWMLAAIFVVAAGFNYLWELAQSPLYVGMGDFSRMLWHCLVASLGDGLLVLLIFGIGWGALGGRDWYAQPGGRGYALMLISGLIIAVAVEWVAVRLAGRWTYNDYMPVVPLLGVGLAPLAQMLLLPPLIFRVSAAWLGRTGNGLGGSNSPER